MNFYALVIDEDEKERDLIRKVLDKEQWRVCEAASVEEADRIIDSFSWSLVVCDASLSVRRAEPLSDLTLLSELKRRFGRKAQIIITAAPQDGSINPLEAFLNGASDYISKPCREERIAACSRQITERLRAAEREAKAAQLARWPRASDSAPVSPDLVGNSEAIIKVFRRLAEILKEIQLDGSGVGGSDARLPSIFITGETGTGKELVAQIIHGRGGRLKGQFVPINCSNLTPELAESELFGHEQGAFTGANGKRPGLWEMADGGTLFLDEITE